MAINNIDKVANILNNLNVGNKVSYNRSLRSSWYVGRLERFGYNTSNINHCKLDCGGFIAELENGLLVTGTNIMITDALTELGYLFNLECPFDTFGEIEGVEVYNGADEDYEDDALLIFTLDAFEEYMNILTNKK